MRKREIFHLASPYREALSVPGYAFGHGEKAACIIGSIRGNEVQQLYVCARLVRKLGELEAAQALVPNKEILVIPSVNHHAMNLGKRFWPVDNTDINRMFPGYDLGETTQRIAAGVFEAVKDYQYGMQLASFYMPGDFIPHVRVIDTGRDYTALAEAFGLPYVVIRTPKPIDTTTLNYNWQIWDAHAFSIYTRETDLIDEASAHEAVHAVLRFLARQGILRTSGRGGYRSTVIPEPSLVSVHTTTGGIYRRLLDPGDEVQIGTPMAEIVHPFEGTVLATICSPVAGVIFFAHRKPLVTEHEVVFKLIRDEASGA